MTWQGDIPLEHLAFLVEGLFAPQPKVAEAERARALLSERGAEPRSALLALLDHRSPGLVERLRTTWVFRHRRAIHLWAAPAFLALPGDATLAEVTRGKGQAGKGGLVILRKVDLPTRVHAVGLDGRQLRAVLRLQKRRRVQLEDEQAEQAATMDVEILVDLAHPSRLTEVYAGYTDGRRALTCFAAWLLGHLVDLGEVGGLLPVDFDERDVKAVALRLGFSTAIALEGPDATGELGPIALKEKRVGTRAMPLNQANHLVSLLESQPADRRTHGYRFVHPDGFVEHSEVRFNFRAKRAQISFQTRTSRPAMKHLVDAIWSETASRQLVVGAAPDDTRRAT